MKLLLIFIFVFFCCILYYFPSINSNTIVFHPDELYWVSTARIVPLVRAGTWNDPFWDEFYGYTNFNGAKWLYGAGFFLAGIDDFSQFGYPPNTFYKYEKIGPSFPVAREEYRYLFLGRIIALGSVAISAGILAAFCAYLAKNNVVVGIVSGLLYIGHPLLTPVATQVYAEGFLLVGLILLLVLSELMVSSQKHSRSLLLFGIWGVVYAISISIKMNAVVFLIILISSMLQRFKQLKSHEYRQEWKNYLVVIVSSCVGFLLLHPNIFFVSALYPITVFMGRLTITDIHMQYFSTEGNHVLWNITDRLDAAVQFLFFGQWPLFIVFLLFIVAVWLCSLLKGSTALFRIGYSGVFVFICCCVYVVFREGRYFLPILPFLIIFLTVGSYELIRYVRCRTFS